MRAVGALEVEAGRDLAARLVDRVAHLLHVDLGDDVERRHRSCLSAASRDVVGGRTENGDCYCTRPGSVPEWPKGAVCKTAAKATLVRIQPGPRLDSATAGSGPPLPMVDTGAVMRRRLRSGASGLLCSPLARRRRRLLQLRVPLREELRRPHVLQGARRVEALRRGRSLDGARLSDLARERDSRPRDELAGGVRRQPAALARSTSGADGRSTRTAIATVQRARLRRVRHASRSRRCATSSSTSTPRSRTRWVEIVAYEQLEPDGGFHGFHLVAEVDDPGRAAS